MSAIPVVDLGEAEGAIAAALDDAYRRVGFCHVVNHGVPDDVVGAVFEVTRRFHALPRSAKEAVALDANHRGFIGLATSTIHTSSVATVTRPNQSESIIFGRHMEPDDPDIVAGLPLSGVNRFPEELPEMPGVVAAVQEHMERLCRRVRRLVALGLGAEPDVFDAAFEPATTYLRLLRYPPARADAPEDEYGSAPHTDYGFVTLLAVDGVPGLEVRAPDGGWIPAVPPPGGFVMNAGDLLHRWSNGRWRSTPHRVRNQAVERYSVPFFYEPHVTATVAPLAHLGAPQFEPVNYGEYAMHRFRSNYAQHGATQSPPSG